MANFDTIQTEVLARLGNRTDITSRLPVWINDAYYEILMAPRFAFYELDKQATAVTTTSLRAYTLPTDLWFILSVRDTTNNRKIRRSHWNIYDKRAATEGIPSTYARFGSTIELDPTPDGAYTLIIRYRYRPSELSSGVSPIVGREWDELLTVLSVIKGFEALEQPEKAVMYRGLFEKLASDRQSLAELEDMDAEFGIAPRLE